MSGARFAHAGGKFARHRRKEHLINFRLTDDEMELVEARCQELEIGISEYVRELLARALDDGGSAA